MNQTIKTVVCQCAFACVWVSAMAARAAIPDVDKPTVRIGYVIPSNRAEQPNGVAILQATFLFYREWCREQMELNGFPDMPFNVETEADGWTPKVYVIPTSQTDAYLASNMWARVGAAADAAGAQLWEANNIWFLVGEAHIMQPDGSLFGHYVGGTGNAQSGVAVVSGDCLTMCAAQYLTNNAAYNGLTIPEIGPYPMVYGTTFGTGEGSTLSSLCSTYLGVNMHEFGHTFHLHHDFRNDWNFFGNLMGNGLRGVRGYVYPARYPNEFTRSSYAFAIQRSLNRFHTPDRVVADTTAPTVSSVPSGTVAVEGGLAVLNFSVSDASGLGLALLVDESGSYAGGVLAQTALSGGATNFVFRTPYYKTTGSVTNQIRIQDVYGNEKAQSFSYSVSGVANRCPWSNIKITPPAPAAGQSVTFDASGSSDPDDSLGSVTVEWDFDNDDVYDTAPMACTSTFATNFATAGLHLVKVRLTDPHGAVWVSSPVGLRVGLVTHYVWPDSPQPEAPYNTWLNAAHTIQEAVDAAADGEEVVVAPGTYASGGAATPGSSALNRVRIDKAVTVRSDAGPEQTVIVGASDGGGFGAAAVRCAFVGTNAVLSGFTLTNGWTMATGDLRRDRSGGGALVIGGTVSNCTIIAGSAHAYGGGAALYYGGAVLDSTLLDNRATRGGGIDLEYGGASPTLVKWCTVRDNVATNYGGGVYCRDVGLIANCVIRGNTAGRYGGGAHLAYNSRAENCLVYDNAATDAVTYGLGGGIMCEFNGAEVESCTVADNSAGRQGGGICIKDGDASVLNCIAYSNTAPSGANWQVANSPAAAMTYSCITPTNGLPSGVGCIDADPLFENEAGRDFRPTRYSPALDAGMNSAWASNVLDVAGNPRVVGAAIDMGAYEYQFLRPPTVTTYPVTNVGATSAECGGEVAAGGLPVTSRGLVWNTTGNPTIAGHDGMTTNGSGAGVFSDTLTGLTPGGQTYYVRAYAVNADGSSYGEERVCATPMAAPGNTLAFDGTDDYAVISDDDALDLTADHTLELWFKADSLSGLRGLISKYQTAAAYGWYLRLNGTEAQFDGLSTSGLNVQPGRWYHLAGVKSGSSFTLYVNGVVVALTGTGNTQSNSNPVRIGSDYSGRYFDGQIEEVRAWNVARTVDDIRDDMHRVLVGTESGLIAYYRFDHVSGTGLSDVSGNGNDGALVNGGAWTGSTFPCAANITNRFNLRGVWTAKTTSLASDRFSVLSAVISGMDFAVFGHDSAADGQTNSADIPSVVDWRLERRWQAELTGAASGSLRFDTTGLSDVGDGSRLCVLADEDGTFTNAAVLRGYFNSGNYTVNGQEIASNGFYTLAKMGAFPSVLTAPVTDITPSSALCGGEVTNQGVSAVVARGVCWNTAGSPTVANSHTEDGSGTGSFVSVIGGLTAGGLYYVRAYASNESGTGYGAERAFYTTMPAPGNALDFDGVNDYVEVPDVPLLDITNNYTLESWFKADGFGGLRGLISKYQTSGANGYFLRLNDNNLDFDGTTASGLNLQAGRWYHVAAVNNNGVRTLHLNGVAQTLSGAPLTVQANANALRIGSDFNGRYFDGQVEEARVWNVVRTEDEIRDEMHKALSGGEPGLAVYYRFDHVSGTTAYDATGRCNGYLYNMNDTDWVASTFPSAVSITNRLKLRGVWTAKTTSLPSGRMSVTNSVVSGTDFAVFGHDNAAETENASDKPATVDWRLNRAWRVEQSGAVTADVELDTTGFTGPFILLADADGVFSDGIRLEGLLSGKTFVARTVALQDGWYYTLGRVDLPQLATLVPSNITWSAAMGGGDITNQGGSAVTARGCVWNTTGNPTLEANDGMTSDGSGAGVFSSMLTGLAERQTYYVRAYASNSQGTGYGDEVSFTSRMMPPGNGLDFDGFNDMAASFNAVAPAIGDELTLEAWVQFDSVSGDRKVVCRRSTISSTRGYILGIIDGMLYPEVWDSTLTHHTFTNGVITAGRWTHLAMTYKRNEYLIGYVDGVEVGRTNVPDLALNPANDYIYIAVGPGAFSFYVDGRMDEVRVWNVARTEDEIRDDMHRTLTGSESGLSAYYNFDQASGSTLDDLTPGYNYANLYNMDNTDWVRSAWPCAHLISGWNNLRAIWVERTNSLDSSILSISQPAMTGTTFAIIGHDGSAFAQNFTDTPTSLYWRLDRCWQMEDGGVTNGAFQFDCTGISSFIGDPAELRLAVDNDGVFTNAIAVSGSYTDGVFSVTNQAMTSGIFYTIGAAANLPVVTTAPISNVTHNSASGGGEVTFAGSGSVTARGVCWSTAASPTTADSRTIDGSGPGAFASVIAGLTPGTSYYVRAYAVNGSGTAYGEQRSFVTDTAPPGDALDFDGADDCVIIPHASIGNPTDSFTIELWARIDAGGSGNDDLVSKHKNEGGSSRSGYTIEYVHDAQRIQVVLGTANGWVSVAGGSWAPGVWHHVALVYDHAAGTLALYEEGRLAGTANVAIPPQYNSNDLYLGGSQSYPGNGFPGSLDEVRYWSAARSVDQIRDNMHKVLSGTEGGLLAYYRFDDGSGTTLTDFTANHIDGVLSNGPVWVAGSFPCAVAIDGCDNLRGAWVAQTNSLASSILSVSNTAVAGLSYRVFGHNGAALTNDTPDKPAATMWRLNRAWQFEGGGSVTGGLLIDCSSIAGLITDTNHLRLLVDTDGSFTNASLFAGMYAGGVFRADGQAPQDGSWYTLGELAMLAIAATAGEHGMINPSGAVAVVYGGATTFTLTPDTYWHVGDVTTNGMSVGTPTQYTWSNVTADGAIHATFAADLAAQGTPHWWLADYGWTTDFDAAEAGNTDNDPYTAGEEYVLDFDPTVSNGWFRITAVSNAAEAATVSFLSSAGRAYTLLGCADLAAGVWAPVAGAGPQPGAGGADSLSDTNAPPQGPFYRVRVDVP
jgi:hypothetical protein